jgi:eukaryotic-like serine/threonine-protein kinase
MAIKVGAKFTSEAEEWLVEELIGSGGFGDIFRMRRIRPAVLDVAIKVMNEERKADPVWVKKFTREARIMGNVAPHPNVVRLLAFWEYPNGDKVLVQEYVPDARKLSMYLHDPNVDRVDLFLQVLYALRAVHGAGADDGVVHRDVTASNILVNKLTGEVKLVDFGLAIEAPRKTAVLTHTGNWFGTPGCVGACPISCVT